MYKQKQKILTNFRKTNSLISKLIKMSQDDKYCVDIMQQTLAAIGLLKSAHRMLMEDHLDNCFKNAMVTKNTKKKREMVEEILKVTKLSNK